MNTQDAFAKFLHDTVDLNKDRVNRIRDAQRVLTEFIKNQDDFESLLIDSIPQGSYRQGTIIKPIGDDGTFDVDLLIRLRENPDWSPADYHAKLAAAFKESGRYKDLTDTYGKTRCVTIDYEGDFHVDLVPAVMRSGELYVCNKTTDEFELTDGDGYARWFDQQNAAIGGHLASAIKLMKYLRDSREEFETKSIILTTIAGLQVQSGDALFTLPEALSAVLTRMDEFLSSFDTAPTIQNPAMPGEDFDRHWKNDSEGFDRLRTAINKYATLANDAIAAGDTDEGFKTWQTLFGSGFPVVEGETDAGMAASAAAPLASRKTSRSFTPPSPYACEE